MVVWYGLLKDSTNQILDYATHADWAENLPTGCSRVELSNNIFPVAEEGDPVDSEGRLFLGDKSIVTVADGVMVRMTDQQIVDNGLLGVIFKSEKTGKIDERTSELILLGFKFPPDSGDYFSLSKEAQIRVHGAYTARSLPEFIYPVPWNYLDDSGVFNIADALVLESFFLTAMSTLRGRVDSGTTLKNEVRAATTVAEVKAVVDSR
jgi:hypothetical protein